MRGLQNLSDVQDIFLMRNVRKKLHIGVVIIPMIDRKMPTHLGWMLNPLEKERLDKILSLIRLNL
jgi:hypothetical protein